MDRKTIDQPAPFGRTHADRKYLDTFGLGGEKSHLGERLTVDGFRDDQRVLIEGMGRALAGAIILEARGVNHNGAFAAGWELVAELKGEERAGFPKEELGVILGHERAEELTMMWGLWGKMRGVVNGEELADPSEVGRMAQLEAENETLRGENERLLAIVAEKNTPRRYETLNESTKELLGEYLRGLGVGEQLALETVTLMADKIGGCKADDKLTVEGLLTLVNERLASTRTKVEREKLEQYLMEWGDVKLTAVGSELSMAVIGAKSAEWQVEHSRQREREVGPPHDKSWRMAIEKQEPAAKEARARLLPILLLREKKADE